MTFRRASRIVTRDCATSTDAIGRATAAIVVLAVWTLSMDVARATTPPQATCAAAKLKAAGKGTAGELKCYTSAIKNARPVDVACLLKAEEKLTTAFVKAEAKGGCTRSGDATTIASDVDDGVTTLVAGEPGGPDGEWRLLVGRSWSTAPGFQRFQCRRVRVPSDVYIKAFRPVSPTGVFEMLVTVSSSTSSPLGDYDCNAGSLDDRLIFASGIGTDDFAFPLGVGVHLHAGDYVNLNVSLANDAAVPANGIAGVLVRTGPASSVLDDAALVLTGTFNISIPSDGMPHTASGGCSWLDETQVVGLWPHLHARGTHVKVVITTGAVPKTVLDAPYTLGDQLVLPTSFPLHAGDSVQTNCTYVNATGHTIFFGESVDSEQCFVGMYVWPSTGQSIFGCATN